MSTDGIDLDEVDRTITVVTAAQTALDAWLAATAPVDPATPSLLPGWTVGHVLTHLARNADSHVRMLAGEPQYPGGDAQRERDIDAGAARPWSEQIADLADAHTRLVAAWAAQTDWSFLADRRAGPRPAAELPFYRWREVEVHRADLGLGYGFADMPDEYVRRELARMEVRWRSARPAERDLPEPVRHLPPPERVAWLLGRARIDGLEPAGIF